MHAATGDQESRRSFVSSASAAVASFGAISLPDAPPATAAYGDSSNMELPNYIEFLIEKNKQVDPDNVLYKGADLDAQLKRLGDAASRLDQIAPLAEGRKWSQVQGIITGPLGTLVQTMNQVAAASEGQEAKEAAKKVKADLIAIGQASARKSNRECIEAAATASRDLEAFIKVAF